MNNDRYESAKKVIQATLKLEKIELSERELDLLVKDIESLLIAIGGELTDSNVRYYLLEMIKNDFYPRFRETHRDEL